MAVTPASFPPDPGPDRTSPRPLWSGRSLWAIADRRLRDVVAGATIELVPMKSLDRAVTELRPTSSVTMTCSPAKSIEATLDESERISAMGHRVVPHISARMVQDADHLAAIHARLRTLDIREIFLVGGDASPPGRFFDAIEFLEAFLRLDDARGTEQRHVDHIGLPAYPDTHPIIPTTQLHDALHRKQELILGSGRTAHVSTQMCFSTDRIRAWLRDERELGLTVPVHLGIPGVIDTTTLLSTGMRLGVGPSLRYLRKNRTALRRLVGQRAFRPDALLRPLADDFESLGIEGAHLYTFNQVAATESWRDQMLG